MAFLLLPHRFLTRNEKAVVVCWQLTVNYNLLLLKHRHVTVHVLHVGNHTRDNPIRCICEMGKMEIYDTSQD